VAEKELDLFQFPAIDVTELMGWCAEDRVEQGGPIASAQRTSERRTK
jgi:hypothetical protein